MSEGPAILLSWEKNQYNGSGAPKIAKTKKHTEWAKKNDVQRSAYFHWGGRVYAFWRFGSEGALMTFILADDLRDAIVPGDAEDLWCKIQNIPNAAAQFRRDIYHDFEEPILRRIAHRIAEAVKTNAVGKVIRHPWEVNEQTLTEVFGEQRGRITFTETVSPNGTILKSTHVRGYLDY